MDEPAFGREKDTCHDPSNSSMSFSSDLYLDHLYAPSGSLKMSFPSESFGFINNSAQKSLARKPLPVCRHSLQGKPEAEVGL